MVPCYNALQVKVYGSQDSYSLDLPDTILRMCRIPFYQIQDLIRIAIYRIYRIPESSKFKHKNYRMKWEYYCQCSLQLKLKQNMYVSIDLNKTGTSLVVYK